jgi:cell division protein FtsW (lipid II flippase)
MLYSILLPIHSILRWIVLLTALYAIVRAFAGWLGKKDWLKADYRAGAWFTMAFDFQLLVGLLLYFAASPLVASALQNFGAAMQNAETRFFALDHVFLMVLALGISHGGRTLSRRAADPLVKHRWAALLYTLALLVLLAAIPWPFAAVARPWIRF